jgi:predicted ATP-grasp superfamily ATP-dependent carboligase
MNVLVTDGDHRSALAIVRSLGRQQVRVWVGEEHEGCLASSSRYCVREIIYPSPTTDPDAFARFLLRFVQRERVDVVMPATDVTTHIVARNADALRAHTAVAVPPFDAFELVSDKWRLLERAVAHDIPIPLTYRVDGLRELTEHLGSLEYPVVVKPTRSRIPTDSGWVSGIAHHVASESALIRLYRDTDYLASRPSLIQERIVGPGMGVFVLCDRGRVEATFQHVRLRERPPSGGVSVLCESAPFDPDLQDQAIRLLEPLGWHGVAMLEYKHDLRRLRPVLMEVNGRFWGSLQLAIDADFDFPYLTYRLALGQPLDLPVPYRVGVKSRWVLGDLDHLLSRLRRGREDLPEDAPSRLGAVVNFLRAAAPGVRGEMLRRDDPGPAYTELCQYTKTLYQSAARRLRGPRARSSFDRLSRSAH